MIITQKLYKHPISPIAKQPEFRLQCLSVSRVNIDLILDSCLHSKMAEQTVRHLVRIVNTDLDGSKPLCKALTKIKGVGFMFANAACILAQMDKYKKVGLLTDEEIKKISDVLKEPAKFSVPSWLLNRRKDPEDGTDKHLVSANVSFVSENDIKYMKKMRSYKGMRHSLGQPVRGQRTRSNFRKNKGKVSLGVKKRADAKAGRP